MPNIKSSKKRVEVAAKKAERNKAYSSALKTELKKANIALENNAEDKSVVVNAAIKKLDQAVTKGILHKNTAARNKSSLAKQLNQD